MREKISVFLSLVAFLGASFVCEAWAVDFIRPEDEALLNDEMMVEVKPASTLRGNLETITTQQAEPVVVEQKVVPVRVLRAVPNDTRYAREIAEIEAARQAGRDNENEGQFVPRRVTTKVVESDPTFNEFRQAISECIGAREEQLSLERDMVERFVSTDAALYLAGTFEEISQCYDDIGADIIEYYYQNDVSMLEQFTAKAKKFRVSATDFSFDAKTCEEFCSVKDVVAAQMEKFAEYRVYLAELLNNRPKEM